MDRLHIKLGNEIKKLRKVKGYTQAQLAEMSGISDNYIGYIERGKQPPSLITLEKIATALDVTVGYLFYSIENLVLKPQKPDKKTLLINKLSNRLKKYSINDIQFIFKIIKRISKGH